VLNNFKFRLFLNGKSYASSNLLHVRFNIQGTSSRTPSFYLSSNPKSRRFGKEVVNLFEWEEVVESLEKKPRKSYKKSHVFQNSWAYCFP
jgi:hypothetical protein